MIIFVKNKHTLQVDEFNLGVVWENGLTNNKIGDKKTPIEPLKSKNFIF